MEKKLVKETAYKGHKIKVFQETTGYAYEIIDGNDESFAEAGGFSSIDVATKDAQEEIKLFADDL